MQLLRTALSGGAGFLLDVIPVAALVCLGTAFLRRRHAFLLEKRELQERIHSYQSAESSLHVQNMSQDDDYTDWQTAGSEVPDEQ